MPWHVDFLQLWCVFMLLLNNIFLLFYVKMAERRSRMYCIQAYCPLCQCAMFATCQFCNAKSIRSIFRLLINGFHIIIRWLRYFQPAESHMHTKVTIGLIQNTKTIESYWRCLHFNVEQLQITAERNYFYILQCSIIMLQWHGRAVMLNLVFLISAILPSKLQSFLYRFNE